MEAASRRRGVSWADLPPDLIRRISGNFPDAADSVRFHAACKAWRGTLPPPHPPPFLPWLLAPGSNSHPWMARLRSIFTKTTWCAPGTSSRRVKWLASADSVGAWLLLITSGGRNVGAGRYPSPPRLVNAFTGAAAALPHLPDEIERLIDIERATGIVAADGAVVLYDIGFYFKGTRCILAAVLRPGDAAWTEAKTVLLPHTALDHRCAAAYHRGEIVLVDLYQSTTVKLQVTAGSGIDDDGVVQELRTTPAEISPYERAAQQPLCIYIFESRGELLAAAVVSPPIAADNGGTSGDLTGALSVWVHAMEAGDGRNSVRWVRRDGWSLRDRVLFLGCPTSFAVDAARFGGAVSSGSAYFVLNAGCGNVPVRSRVYRHSFGDGSTALVEELPAGAGWDVDKRMMWFTPQPSGFAPAQDIGGRLLAPKERQTAPCQIKIIRCGSTSRFRPRGPTSRIRPPLLKMYVGNLPGWVCSVMLRVFFARYGIVMDARVICDTRSGQSLGFGLVTMEAFDEPDSAIATFNGEMFYGDVLRVKSSRRTTTGPFVTLRAPIKI